MFALTFREEVDLRVRPDGTPRLQMCSESKYIDIIALFASVVICVHGRCRLGLEVSGRVAQDRLHFGQVEPPKLQPV